MRNNNVNIRLKDRDLKSIYFDRTDNYIKQATHCIRKPHCRPRTYIFIGQFKYVPRKTNKNVTTVLLANGIKLNTVLDYTDFYKKLNKIDDLPF